jgi:hypothetical protein
MFHNEGYYSIGHNKMQEFFSGIRKKKKAL